MEKGTGRRIPSDWEHVDKYQLRTLGFETISNVERTLLLPYQYRKKYDQGTEGACVGFSSSWLSSINNKKFFDAHWLYREAQRIDEWEGEDYDGTSVRAGMDVLRKVGHRQKWGPIAKPANPDFGIAANRWARSVDEVRTCIANGMPVVMGTNWYAGFDSPIQRGREFWVPGDNIGKVRGGHAWCIYGASDRRQAFKMVNSWGDEYPLTWFPYSLVGRLINEYGEATVITDR